MSYRDGAGPLPRDRSILVVGLNGKVYGIDRATGELRWRNDLKGGGFGEVFLAVDYGVIVASAGGAMMYCLDYLTGQERWRAATQASGRATILIEPDHIVCAKGGYVDAYTVEGRRLWSQPLSGAGVGRVALGYPGNVVQADDPGTE